MADNMTRQSITLAMQITERAASIVATEVNAVTNLLQAVADYDNSAEKLLEYQKEGYGKLNYNLCDKAYSGDFEQKLKQEGVVYYKLQNTRNPNYDIYVYPDCYSNRVTDIVKDHMIQNGMVNVVGKDELIRSYKGNGLQSIDELSQNQVSIMKDLLRDKHVTIALTPSDREGKYKLYFHEKDRSSIEKALLQHLILTNSRSESKIAEAMAFDLSHKQQLFEHIRDNKDGHYYIMSEDKDMIEIKQNGFAYRGQDGRYVISKDDPQHQDKAFATISRMQRPVEMTRSEFQAYAKAGEKDRRKMYIQKVKDEKYPDYSLSIAKEMKELERKTSLLEKKLSMDNPDRQLSEYDLFNDQMSFTAFEEEENRNMNFEEYKNDMDEKEIENIHKEFEQYHVESEEINFSQYQILYEESKRQDRIPYFLRDTQDRDAVQDIKDEMDRFDYVDPDDHDVH